MDCCGLGGTVGSGHERAQEAPGLRALITRQARCTAEVESRAPEQRTGLKWLTTRGSGDAGHGRAQSRGGPGGNMNGTKMRPPSLPPPPPLPPFFYRAVG